MSESDVKGVQKLSWEPLTEDGSEVVTLWSEVEEGTGDVVVHSAAQDGTANMLVVPDTNIAERRVADMIAKWRLYLKAEAYPGYDEANEIVRAEAGYDCF